MKTIRYLEIIVAMLILSMQISCKKPADVIEDPNLLKSLYADSQDTLIIENHRYILQTLLYRDFMPSVPESPSPPLTSLVFLVNLDSLSIPNNINILKLYVIKDQLIWISTPVDGNQPQNPNFKLNKLSNKGPAWDTGIQVDVVIEVVNNSNNNKYFLIAKDQYIGRLD